MTIMKLLQQDLMFIQNFQMLRYATILESLSHPWRREFYFSFKNCSTVPATIYWTSPHDKLCYAREIFLRFDRGIMCAMAVATLNIYYVKVRHSLWFTLGQ